MKRYYLGVDWADKVHQVWVGDFEGNKVAEMKVAQTPEGMSEFSRWLHERRAQGIELWAAIEKPEGRIVDFFWMMEWWFIRLIPKRWIVPGTGSA